MTEYWCPISQEPENAAGVVDNRPSILDTEEVQWLNGIKSVSTDGRCAITLPSTNACLARWNSNLIWDLVEVNDGKILFWRDNNKNIDLDIFDCTSLKAMINSGLFAFRWPTSHLESSPLWLQRLYEVNRHLCCSIIDLPNLPYVANMTDTLGSICSETISNFI